MKRTFQHIGFACLLAVGVGRLAYWAIGVREEWNVEAVEPVPGQWL